MARNAIDSVRSAFQARRRKLVVPEWDNLEMYFGPLTVDDMESVQSRVRNPDSQFELQVLMLIHKARDVDGKALFAFGDKVVLMKEADLTILQRVIAFMWEGVPTLELATEQVEQNPISGSS